MSFRLVNLFKVLCLTATLAVASFSAPPPADAAQECRFMMDDGTPRECTFTERYGQCLYWAYYSYITCSDPDDGWGGWLICEAGYQVDLLACSLAMIGDAIGLLTPF